MSAAEIAKKVGCTTGLVYNVKARMGGTKRTAARRGGRRSRASSAEANGLASVFAAMQGAEREHAQLRAALQKIQSVIADVLARP